MADTWEVISGYSATDYVDTMTFEVDAETKKLAKLSGQTLVAGEKNSQYIQIKMPRYWDGIDISEMNIGIIYDLNNSEYFGTTQAISAERTTDSIRFGWVVPEDACAVKGTLLFVIIVKGTNYILKTQIADTPVVKSLSEDGDIPEPTKETWYADFQVRVERTLSAAENAVEEAQSTLAQARSLIGSPLVANTAADMADTSRIYVYTGSETGYTNGHWYYHNGSAWTDGGVYNAVAVDTDTTLSISGKAADAKKTGDEINSIKEDFDAIFTETPTDNLFNKDDAITGSYINPYTGEVVEYSGVFHEFIEFEAGTYTFLAQPGIFGGNAYSVAMFDENHNFVSYAEGTHTEIDTMNSIINVTFSSQAASTAKYFNINGTTDILNTLMVVKGTQYPTEYIPYGTYKTIDGLQISKSQIIDLDDETNPLKGKIISLNGDSIAAGAGYAGGYGKIIAEENGMTYENVAVGGGTMAYVGSNVHCISRTISNMRADADYVILDGGGNDADSGVPLGALTTGYTATLDDTTFAGAFEQMLKSAIARFPNKKIGYVFIHKCAYLFSSSVKDSYYDIAKAACEKWGIPYCDLNTQIPPLNYIDALKTAYTSNGDGYHPNEQGYRLFYVPKITAWMKTL